MNHRTLHNSDDAEMSNAGTRHGGRENAPISHSGTVATGDPLLSRMQALVGRNKRTLLLGGKPELVSLLHDSGCSVFVVGTNRDAIEQVEELCERIIFGSLIDIDIAGELAGEKFDVVVSMDSLTNVKDPFQVLQAFRALLRLDGYLVACVPNVAHASTRLALLEGEFSQREGGDADDKPLHFFTRESLERLVQQASFGLARLEREEIALDVSSSQVRAATLSAELLAYLSRDPDARTNRFIIMAYPMPREDLQIIQQRWQSLVEDNELARYRLQELDELALRVQQQETGIAFLRNEIGRREQVAAELQEHVHGLIGALGQKDAEIAENRHSLQELRNTSMQAAGALAALQAESAQTIAEVRAYRQSKLVRIVRLYWSVRQRFF